MKIYFKEEFYTQSKEQRKKVLLVYLGVLLVYLAFSVIIIVKNSQLTYMSPVKSKLKLIEFVLTFIMIIFSYIYLGIKYKRVNKYYQMCRNMLFGIREEFEGSFFEFNNNLYTKDGVDVKPLVFLEYNKYKKDYFERKVWWFYEQPFPEINENDVAHVITQGNMLIGLEIIEEEKED